MSSTLRTSAEAREYFARNRVSPPGVVPVVMATVQRLAVLETQTLLQAASIAALQEQVAQLEAQVTTCEASRSAAAADCVTVRDTLTSLLPIGLGAILQRAIDELTS